MGSRHNLAGGRERIKAEMPLLKPPPLSLIMVLQWILPGDSDLRVRGSVFSGVGTDH